MQHGHFFNTTFINDMIINVLTQEYEGIVICNLGLPVLFYCYHMRHLFHCYLSIFVPVRHTLVCKIHDIWPHALLCLHHLSGLTQHNLSFLTQILYLAFSTLLHKSINSLISLVASSVKNHKLCTYLVKTNYTIFQMMNILHVF